MIFEAGERYPSAMVLIRWRKRLLACSALCIAALALFVGTPHRLRLAVMKLIPLDSTRVLNNAPEQSRMFQFYPVQRPEATRRGSFAAAMRLFEEYTLAYPPKDGWPLAMSESPDSCLEALHDRRPVHCYNVDIAYAQIFGANGYYTRMWDLAGSQGLGGYGHNILELWDEASGKWKAVDPFYHCYFTRGDSAIGIIELRERLLANDTSVHVMSYYERDSIYDSATRSFVHPIYRAPKELLGELRFLAPAAMVHANNAFLARYAHRYGVLQFLAPLFDRLPMQCRRGVRATMMGSSDARYIIEDRYTPTFRAATVHFSARALGVLSMLFALLSAIGFVRSFRVPAVVVAPQKAQRRVLA